MRALVAVFALGVIWVVSCASTDDDIGAVPAKDGGKDGTAAKGGGSATGGKGGTGGFGGSGGTSFTGGTGGFGGTGGKGGTGGASDGGLDGDSGIPGFGPCVTQAEIDSQGSAPLQIGFCIHFFSPFLCGQCMDDAVNPGDMVCGPDCLCKPLPPICGTEDAGADVIDEGSEAGDASADVSTD